MSDVLGWEVGQRVDSFYGVEHRGVIIKVGSFSSGKPMLHVRRDSDGFVWIGWPGTIMVAGAHEEHATSERRGQTPPRLDGRGAVDLQAFVVEEQAILWHELATAIRTSINGSWSMLAENITDRIVQAVHLVGPTEHGDIPYSLVAGGVYEALLAGAGIEHESPDAAEWVRLDELMAQFGETRELSGPRFAQTVAAIREHVRAAGQ